MSDLIVSQWSQTFLTVMTSFLHCFRKAKFPHLKTGYSPAAVKLSRKTKDVI